MSCSHIDSITKEELFTLTKTWKELKSAMWYYQGSDNSYHYFKYEDLGVNKEYKVLRDKLPIDNTFALTKTRKEWRFMPWGPYASKGNET